MDSDFTLNEYQDLAMDLRGETSTPMYAVLKLSGEAGEVSEKYGKQIRDKGGDFNDPEFKQAIAKELGDVLWYISAIAEDIGLTLAQVADLNLTKLNSRRDRGVLQGSGDDR